MSHKDEMPTTETQSLGLRLKLAREAKQIPVDAIANQLRIKKERILELENDNYDNMPGLVYARGYLRSYANLLNMPLQEGDMAFEEAIVPEVRELHAPQYLDHKPLTSKHYLVRWVSYSIGMLFIILVFLWWHEHEDVSGKLKSFFSADAKVKTVGTAANMPNNNAGENTTQILNMTTPAANQPSGSAQPSADTTQSSTAPGAADDIDDFHSDNTTNH